MLPAFALVWLAGSMAVLLLPRLPGLLAWAWAALAFACLAGVLWRVLPKLERLPQAHLMARQRVPLVLAWLLLGLAFCLTGVRAEWAMAPVLKAHEAARSGLYVVRIAGLASRRLDSLSVPIELEGQAPGAPWRFTLSVWRPSGDWLEPAPGQRWQMHLSLQATTGLANPGSPWTGAWALREGLHGQARPVLANGRGYGRRAALTTHSAGGDAAPLRLPDVSVWEPSLWVARLRHALREQLRAHLPEPGPGRAIVQALALGDAAELEPAHWRAVNLLGVGHLIAVSGAHVTLIGALAMLLLRQVWPRIGWRNWWLAEHWPAQGPALWLGLLCAAAYAAISGWGIPAQRTLFMLALFGWIWRCGWLLPTSSVLLGVAALVLILDPWAPLSPGFWLSFGAVAIILRHGRLVELPRSANWRQTLRLQWGVSVGLVPGSVLLFNQVSLVGPLANLVAIPLVGLLITPICVIGMFLLAVPGLNIAAAWALQQVTYAIDAAMPWLVAWSSRPDWQLAWPVADPPLVWLLFSLAGVWLAGCLPGNPLRQAGWLMALSIMAHGPDRPRPGEWRLVALDVGQGSSLVLFTRRHVLVFDTGPPMGRNTAAARVLEPMLRAAGHRQIDWLIISHHDVDHASGLDDLLAAQPVHELISSEPLQPLAAQAPGRQLPCLAGQAWEADGVRFAMLHPQQSAPVQGWPDKARNDESCVLSIRGAHAAALLTGDIGRGVEAALVAQGAITPHEVVLAPHHGSHGSSGPDLVQAVQARHVILQAGRANRYGHPHPAVMSAWAAAGAHLWRTDRLGAITFDSSALGLIPRSWRAASLRWWHGS